MRSATAAADGFVANTKQALYTVPSGKKFYWSSVTFHNINAAAQTLIVYLNRTGTSRIIGRFANFAQNETITGDAGATLDAGDIIEAQTTTASAVHFTVSGVTEE